MRLIRYLDGGTLHGSGYLSPATVAEMGRVCGEVSAALANLPTTPAERVLQWDLRQGPRVVEFLAEHIADADLRERVTRVTRAEARRVERVASLLPVQVVHGDLTDDNLMRSATPDDERLLDGVIDFGDLMLSWRVAELATTISSILHHDGASCLSVLPAIRSFHGIRPLSIHEVEALWPLVVIRGAVLVASGHQQVGADESNDYALEGLLREQLIFDRASSIPSEVMTEIIAQQLGLRPPGSARTMTPSRLFDTDRTVAQLDLGVASPILDEGAWMTDESARRAVAEAVGGLLAGGHEVVIAPFGAIDATRSRPLVDRAGGDMADRDGRVGRHRGGAPGTVAGRGDRHAGRARPDRRRRDPPDHRGRRACRDRLPCRRGVVTGTPLGMLRPGTRYRLTVRANDFESDVPAFVLPEHAPGWMPYLFDPAASFGLGDAEPSRSDDSGGDLMSRREACWQTCRSTTTRDLRASSEGGGITWSPTTAGCSSTWSTTSRCSGTVTRGWRVPSPTSGAPSTPTPGSTTHRSSRSPRS